MNNATNLSTNGWLLYAIFTIACYGLHDVILKHLAGNIHPILASLIINAAAFCSMLVLYTVPDIRFSNTIGNHHIAMQQIVLLIVAGMALGLATATFIISFANGGTFSIIVPFVYISIIIASIIIGYLFYAEKINAMQLLGIALSCIGLYLIVKKSPAIS